MARAKERKNEKEQRLQKTRERIEGAQRRLYRSLLALILRNVTIIECTGIESDPLIACVDTEQGAIWLNPHARPELGEPEWTFALAHQLLHLGLRHEARRENRDPVLWNLACEHAADNLLYSFKIGTAPHDFAIDLSFAGLSEEEIYERLSLDRKHALADNKTYAGMRRSDMVRGRTVVTSLYSRSRERKDYETLLAEGIRQAVDDAVYAAAETFGQEVVAKGGWRLAEDARRWVLSEFPLLGALAVEIKIVADKELCERMDIPVAAINGYLGEMYLRPDIGLTKEELIFVYVHELLHVALLHHTRVRGRDPWLWNIACDFVINGWLVEMGIGRLPALGGLYDPRLKNMGSEEVYDLLSQDSRRVKGLRGFRGGLGDVLLDTPGRRIYKGDVGTLDDMYRRCISVGLSCHQRGTLPAGLLEEVRALFTPPVPWDVELARWMDKHIPALRDYRRSYARASRRQASTPEIPRAARYIPQEVIDACTFGVVMDTSGSMDRELLGRALGAISSYAEARDVPVVRLILCDAAPYDKGFLAPGDLRGNVAVQGRGGTALQAGINYLLTRPDFPPAAPIMVITDGWCEEEILCPREHCFVLPRKGWKEGAMSLRTSAPVFRVLRDDHALDD